MTQEQEAEVQRLIKDIDVTELMNMLKKMVIGIAEEY